MTRLLRFYFNWPSAKPRGGPALLWLAAGAVVGLILRAALG